MNFAFILLLVAIYQVLPTLFAQPRTRPRGGSEWRMYHVAKRDDELVRSHRVTWAIFDHILDKLRADLTPVRRKGVRTVEPDEQLAMFLHRLAKGMDYSDLSGRYDVAKSTAIVFVKRITGSFLIQFQDVISLPSLDEIPAIAAGFSSATGGRLRCCP